MTTGCMVDARDLTLDRDVSVHRLKRTASQAIDVPDGHRALVRASIKKRSSAYGLHSVHETQLTSLPIRTVQSVDHHSIAALVET